MSQVDSTIEIYQEETNLQVIQNFDPPKEIIEISSGETLQIFNSSEVIFVNSGGSSGGIGQGDVFKVKKLASTALSGHRAMILNSDGRLAYASNNNPAHRGRVIGISLNAAASGDLIEVQTHSDVVEPSWNWNLGLPIFLGQDGYLTQTAPTSATALFIQTIGFPVSPTSMFVDIGYCINLN